MIQVLAGDAAELVERFDVLLERVAPVDEQVALIAAAGRRGSRGRYRRAAVRGRGVEPGNHDLDQLCTFAPRMRWLSPNSCQR